MDFRRKRWGSVNRALRETRDSDFSARLQRGEKLLAERVRPVVRVRLTLYFGSDEAEQLTGEGHDVTLGEATAAELAVNRLREDASGAGIVGMRGGFERKCHLDEPVGERPPPTEIGHRYMKERCQP